MDAAFPDRSDRPRRRPVPGRAVARAVVGPASGAPVFLLVLGAALLLWGLLFPGLVRAEGADDAGPLRTWPDGWYSREAAIMGTRIRVELQAAAQPDAEAAIDAVLDELRRIDATYSTWSDASDLSRVNREAGSAATPASAELRHLLAESREVSELTDGAFDVTYASAGRLYDFREGVRPDDEARRAAVEAIDYHYVRVDDDAGTVRYDHPDVWVDLGGIAKGYAIDRAMAILAERGVANAAVAAGGDMRVTGVRQGRPWVIGVRDPDDRDTMVARLPLQDVAVSTSGDYERFFDEDGIRYHHILDPATGDSARGVRSVTIIGDRATRTDALSTSVFVLGREAGLALVDRLPGIDALVVDADGSLHVSEGLRRAM
jgi:thiamine biosynthesis lipoprotein